MNHCSSDGISFYLTKEQQSLVDTARMFARDVIAPSAIYYDSLEEDPTKIVAQARKLGLPYINIPEEYGGLGLSLLTECLIAEQLAWGCAGIWLAITITNLATLPIILAGTEKQKQAYFGRVINQGARASYCVTEPNTGSDIAAIQSTATPANDHYILTGTKRFISGAPQADFYTVLARTQEMNKNPGDQRHLGLSFFIVDRGIGGLLVSAPFKKLGQRASETADVIFDHVNVPRENLLGHADQGFKIAMQVFDFSRPVIAAAAVGVAQRALDESIKYAKTRETWGKPIFNHQEIGHTIAEIAAQIEAARLLVWKAAWLADQGRSNTLAASYAKLFSAQTVKRATESAIQSHGGYGYIADYPVEKLYRDAPVFGIYEGTDQIQKMIIAKGL